MDPFWQFARRMLRYRGQVILALIMASLSAGSLGAGLVGMTPVLRNILSGPTEDNSIQAQVRQWNLRAPPDQRLPEAVVARVPDSSAPTRGLRQLARDWNATHSTGAIPESVVESLPVEPLNAASNLRELALEANARWAHGRIPQSWIDALPTGKLNTIVFLVGGLGVLTVFGGFANFMHAFLSMTIIQRTIADIRREAFHRVLRLPLKDIVSGGSSDKVSRIVGDTSTLETGFTSLLSKAVAQFTKGVATLAAAFLIDWRLALAALGVLPILFVVIRRLGKRIRRASRSALQSVAGLYGAANEALQGLRVVKVHTTERYEAGRFHRLNKEVMRQMFRARTARALSTPVVEVLSILVLGTLSVIAIHQIQMKHLLVEEFLGTLAALGAAGASLKPLTGLVNDIQVAHGAAVRIQEVLQARPEPGHDNSLPRLGRHKESIEFRNVTFTYPGALRPALDRIRVKIEHGQRIAVVGPNGSGKTTLLALVPRLFDPNPADAAGAPGGPGGVYIDGQDIRSVSVRSLRRQIGVVTQETVLFRGTVRSNIAYGAEDATEERIIAAAKKARAHEFIQALPQGYDTAVGEQGLTLSGGQRQRIAIARAILREPSILILDEATSMVDADSEAKIAEALAEFTQGRTCLTVAHRLSTVINADRILVMDSGRIVDDGTHAELLKRCSTYRLIAENQLVKGEPDAKRGKGAA